MAIAAGAGAAAVAAALAVIAVYPSEPEDDSVPMSSRGPGPAASGGAEGAGRPDPPGPPRAHCPAGLAGCRAATGRIIYVERVDPDGDGDAHFVLASSDSITAPGLSVIDVRRELRPQPLPGAGDRISAAGPVYEGSYGQRQIEAVVVHTER